MPQLPYLGRWAAEYTPESRIAERPLRVGSRNSTSGQNQSLNLTAVRGSQSAFSLAGYIAPMRTYRNDSENANAVSNRVRSGLPRRKSKRVSNQAFRQDYLFVNVSNDFLA